MRQSFDEVVRLKCARGPLLLLAATASLAGSDASHLYRQARQAEHRGDIAQAYVLYSEAAAANPRKPSYRLHAEALATQAAQLAHVTPSPSEMAAELPPLPVVFESWTERELAASRQTLPPASLHARPGRQSFDLEGDYHAVFIEVAKRFDLEAVFDSEYSSTKRLRFRLDEADYREALHSLEAATKSFVIPLSPKLMMIAEDTEQKRKDLEQVATVSVPVPQALTPQDLTELGQAIKQTVGLEKIAWDASASQIVLRDRVSRVLAAEALLSQLVAFRTRVEVDLQFIEVRESDMLDLGVDVTLSSPLVYLGQFMRSKPTLPSVAGLIKFGGGRTIFGFGAINANAIAQMNASSARTLLSTSIVSVDGLPATFHAGDKFPILTSGYFGVGSSSAQAYRPPPSFTYEDLGLVVKVTPHAHGMREMSLDVDTEFKVLGGSGVNGIPIISSRKFQSNVRLKNNEWAIVAGVMTTNISRVKSGIPLLSRIPWVSALTSRFTRKEDHSYVLMVIKPRLMSMPPNQTVTHAVYVGSDVRSITPL